MPKIIKIFILLLLSSEITYFIYQYKKEQKLEGHIEKITQICAPYGYCIYQFKFYEKKDWYKFKTNKKLSINIPKGQKIKIMISENPIFISKNKIKIERL